MLQSKLDKASIKWEAGITDLMFRWDWNQTFKTELETHLRSNQYAYIILIRALSSA